MNERNLIYRDFNPHQEALRETLCTLGNGLFATRGATPESKADEVHYPGVYAAGCFNRLETELAGRIIENECMVNLPNWLDHSFRLPDGEWFDPLSVELLDYCQELDLRNASLKRSIRFRDASGRHTRIEEQRMISMSQPHFAAFTVTICAEDWEGTLQIRSGLDGNVRNCGVQRYRALNNQHLQPVSAETVDGQIMLLEVITSQSRVHIAMGAVLRFWQEGKELLPQFEIEKTARSVSHHYQLELGREQPLVMEKLVSLFSCRDRAISTPALAARKSAASGIRYAELARPHTVIWRQLWQHFYFDIEHEDAQEDAESEQILDLHIFHLLQTYSPHVVDLDAGLPARGLHGEAYRGHIFWDELFVLPMFNLRLPAISRAHLLYRYRRLQQACSDARTAGYEGAMYPWQSGSNGREESQELHLNPESGNWIPDNSRLQRHIGAAVAFNVCHYYQATKDEEFLSRYGAEMLLEIARFWASKATYNSTRERYEILRVMGPDEYHDSYPDADLPGLDNNAYTNILAVWVLIQALDVKNNLPARRFKEICEVIHLEREELEHWEQISRRMYVPFHDDGIISQFEGYEKLKEFDWDRYRARYPDIQRLDRILEAEGDTPNRYKASKQADVLMLFYLFSAEELGELFQRLDYPFEYQTIPRNIDYYLHRTSHGSTLSRVVHSWVLARGNRPESWQFFKQSLKGDVEDIQGGTTQEGIHAGAMAGTIDLMQRCFTGLETRNDVLWLNPRLPRGLLSLAFEIHYRKHEMRIYITANAIRIAIEPAYEMPICVGVKSERYWMKAGETREFML